jgi:hypothetical protein
MTKDASGANVISSEIPVTHKPSWKDKLTMEGFVEWGRKVVVIILLLGIACYAGLMLLYLANASSNCCTWVKEVVNPDPTVRVYTFGLPFCAIAAFGIVGLFEWHSQAKGEGGKVSFKAFGLEFSGPAGPVTLWILCYLALVGSMRLVP